MSSWSSFVCSAARAMSRAAKKSATMSRLSSTSPTGFSRSKPRSVSICSISRTISGSASSGASAASSCSCAHWLSHSCRSRPGSVIFASSVASTRFHVPDESSQNPGRLLALGVSHHHAPLEVRERLYLQDGQAAELAAELGDAVVLSTCNRTEVYLAGGDPERARRELERRSGLELENVLARWDEDEAVAHLFRVAAGLDSLVPGESQILGQIRDAYESARTRSATGALLNRLFEDALRAGKRVRTEAKLHELPESVAASAVELGVRELGGAEGRRVLLFGAGKMSELAARELHSRGAEVVVSSRTLESAQDLAERVGGRAAAFDAVAVELPEADLVISATRCPYPILHAEAVRPREKPLVLVDVAVPRDLDPAIGQLDGCTLYDIDALGDGLLGREEDIAEAEGIVAEEAARFAEWRRSRDAVEAIRDLRSRAEEIRSDELARVGSRLPRRSPPRAGTRGT